MINFERGYVYGGILDSYWVGKKMANSGELALGWWRHLVVAIWQPYAGSKRLSAVQESQLFSVHAHLLDRVLLGQPRCHYIELYSAI